MNENGEIYTTGKNFTLPPAMVGVTNITSGPGHLVTKNAGLLKKKYFEKNKTGSCKSNICGRKDGMGQTMETKNRI